MPKFLTLCLLTLLVSCQTESRKKSLKVDLSTPGGKVIETRVAVTPAEQEQGLSGVKPENFDDNEGMLFFYTEDSDKFFWMPDTYFDLDLFYLDKELRVLDIVRKLPHHPGRHNEAMIPRARGVWCRHTLEMKSSSPIAAEIKIGDHLIVSGSTIQELEHKANEILKK